MKRASAILLIALISLFPAHQVTALLDPSHHYHLYLWAQYNQEKKNHEMVRICYRILFSHEPSPHIYPGFLEHLFHLGQYPTIIQIQPLIEKSIKLNAHSQLILAESLLAIGHTTNALAMFDKLVAENKTNADIIYKAAQASMVANSPANALRYIEGYLNNAPCHSNTCVFHFAKAQILTMMKNNTSARQSALKTVELQPNFEQAWLLLGFLDELEGNSTQAINDYQRYLEIAGPNQLVEAMLHRLKGISSNKISSTP